MHHSSARYFLFDLIIYLFIYFLLCQLFWIIFKKKMLQKFGICICKSWCGKTNCFILRGINWLRFAAIVKNNFNKKKQIYTSALTWRRAVCGCAAAQVRLIKWLGRHTFTGRDAATYGGQRVGHCGKSKGLNFRIVMANFCTPSTSSHINQPPSPPSHSLGGGFPLPSNSHTPSDTHTNTHSSLCGCTTEPWSAASPLPLHTRRGMSALIISTVPCLLQDLLF